MDGRSLFNDNWEFVRTGTGTGIEELAEYESGFCRVDIPHDWLIYDTRKLYESGTGWYRKRFDAGERNGVRKLLYFDGVYMDSIVYVNGNKAGEWKYGYSAFELDITDLLEEGTNEVLVQVNYVSPNSRWYSGAGIYRNVFLRTAPENHIVTDSLYVSAKPSGEGDDWTVNVDAQILWHTMPQDTDFSLCYELTDGKKTVASLNRDLCCGQQPDTGFLQVTHPRLWEPETPNVYRMKVTLKALTRAGDSKTEDGGQEEKLDTVSAAMGFRTTEWNPEKGFLLNGRAVKLRGVCEHHDLGSLGGAFHRPAMKRKLEMLKRMGANAIRTTHNMPAAELMELTDEMGLMVVSESFDMWEKPKTEQDYSRFFKEWAERDVASWVRRDRNHPSLILWSIGNEIYDTHADEHGQDITRRLMNAVLVHDPAQNGAVTIGSNYMGGENARKCMDIVKVAGYNYGEKYYEDHHARHTDWVIYGSETSSVVQSRGVYHFPFEQSILTEEDEQCSALGNSTTSWGAKSAEYCICADRDAEYCAGQFIWTGYDYIGEPTPYQTKNSYFGQIDTAGFPKDSYYTYQAAWTDYRKAPMVHIYPYWDFNEGQLIDIRACTNAPKIEIFVNGISQGITQIDHAHGKELLAHVKVPYEAGKISAVAYDEEGAVVAQTQEHSFGESARITLKPDRQWLKADGEDMIFVEIGMEDSEGYPVRNASDYVEITVTGAGRLVGLDNGDSTDYDQYKGTRRKLFNGKLLAVIAAKKTPGPIGITVTDIGVEEDIRPETLTVQAIAAHSRAGICASAENRDMPPVTGGNIKIPVRKIELGSNRKKLGKEEKEILVKAWIHPADATDRQVEWSVVNDSGIPSNLAKLEILDTPEGAEGAISAVRITALGDGSFRVRCNSRNGSDKVKLISQLEFTAEGIGEAFLNPYEFVAGGLYNAHQGEVGSYKEKSVGTAQEGDTCIGYEGIEFGDYGSDEITIPVFAMTEDRYVMELWEGAPGEPDSELLTEAVYQKPCVWDVFQPVTYKLPRRLKGVTSLYFATHGQSLFMKGFTFKKYEKAYACLQALECDRVYGDLYRKTEDAIEKIGNNVTLEYGGMDFGSEGCTRITICGRTPLQNNTIHIRFFGKDKDVNQLAEFAFSEDYEERTFTLEPVTGIQKVTFVFLPGCNFDFKWFRFE